MIDLEWFRTFKTIYEKGSMTAAAAHLMSSQPGVSLHLSSLENHVGYKLFERRPRLLIPTERGKQLYNSLVDPLNRLEEIELKSQRGASNERPTITLGMCFETFQLSLEPSLPELPFNLVLEFGDYRQLLQKLESKVTDLVISPHNPELRDVRYKAFSQENIVLVAGKGMPSFDFEGSTQRKRLDWLVDKKWYGIAGDNDHMNRFWKLNFGKTPDFKPNYIVPNFNSILRSLARAPGLAIIPDFLCQESIKKRNVKIIWKGTKPLRNTLFFAHHKSNPNEEALQKIMGKIQSYMPPLVQN